MNVTENPLLNFTGLPQFDRWDPKWVAPALSFLLEQALKIRGSVLAQDPPTWEGLMVPLNQAHDELTRAWGQVSHLNAVQDTPVLREVYNDWLPKVTEYWVSLAQDHELYHRLQELYNNLPKTPENDLKIRVLELALRDFRLGGADLDASDKKRFAEIQAQQAAMGARFEQNLLDATDAFVYDVSDESLLAGLPPDVISACRQRAERAGVTGYRLNIQAPCYIPVMQYADHRPLRAHLYRAYATRASEWGPEGWDNGPVIEKLLALRAEESHLLGYQHYAALSLETKMASSVAAVQTFLDDLVKGVKSKAQEDWVRLQAYGITQGYETVEPWDVAWLSERLRQEQFSYSEQEVRSYFTMERVLHGLFLVIQRLYGLSVHEKDVPVWHPSVRFFELRDRQHQVIGAFYTDLFAREGKRGGAWMDEVMTRARFAETVRVPVAYLNANFSAPLGTEQATLTHDEVITLFHECGHGLHHLLTEIDEPSISGINGVEWDAVELPSQFMENFCWDESVINELSGHVETGRPIPQDLFAKMKKARHFQAGMQLIRQLEFSLFDWVLHASWPLQGKPLELLQKVREQVSVVIPPEWHRFPQGFAHIFAGGYAAGYYSYLWAEVLSADAFEAFEEHGIWNQNIGQKFRSEILAKGGSRDALDSFIAFRGREPSVNPLLRQRGLVTTTDDHPA